jgi:hypothetical protein
MAFKMKRRNGITEEEIVESRLRHFIRKYYRVKIVQGLIVSASVTLVLLFGLIVFGNAISVGKDTQIWIAISCIIILAGTVFVFLIKPLAQNFGYINGLNFKEASSIIQQKHKSVEDRIINIIELTKEKAGKNNKLYDYAIAQKTENVRDINFDDAISLRKLGMFIIRLGLLIAFSCGIVLLWPDFVKKGIGSMWSGSEQISGLNKIGFEILNDSLEVESGKDFLLRFKVLSELPVEKVNLRIGYEEWKVEKAGDSFEYLFKAVNSSVSFRIGCNGILSGEYVLKTLKKPEISGIQIKVKPPSYTDLESMVIVGDGNAEVPAGARINWSIKTVNTDQLLMIEGADTIELKEHGKEWNHERTVNNNYNYEILCKNLNGLIINYYYKITITKDLYPTIDISDSRDSTIANEVYIQGIIQDDYGFSKLELIGDRLNKEMAREIEIKKSSLYENFYYRLVPDSNSTVYFFRIWDNDQVTGPKFTDSRKITLKTISKEEVANINSQLIDSIKSTMTDGMSAIDRMEKEVSQFKMEMVLGDLKPWEIQEKMKELNDLKQEVVEFMDNIAKTDKEFTENENFLNQDKELTEKAKQIQDLMENLLDDEMKELLKQFEELAKEFDSQKANDLTDKMQMNLDKLKEQMEMSLELLKKYVMEKALIEQVNKLNQLADSLDKDKSDLQNSGNNFKEEFKKWEKDYDANLKQNQGFKKPMALDSLANEREEVRKSAEEMNKEESGKSPSEKKKAAAKGLKKLAKKMESMLGTMEGEAQTIDLEDLRQIRNSLNDFSKIQEGLNNRILRINTVNPTFTEVIKEQKGLEDKFIRIRDSLKSMGYRQPMVTKIIGAELFHVETSLKNLFESYADNQANVVRVEQNRIMSEVNSIAVKLDELISNMQNATGSGSGKSSFSDRKKPKEGEQAGSKKIGETQSMQQSLKEQLKNSIQRMKSGQNGKKERSDLAKMLGEREMMRKALEKLLQGGELGTEAREKANEALNMMKEVEKDIIYNKLSDKTLEKDNLIRTKLLDAENAEKERENENRRESKEFKGSFEPNKRELEKEAGQNKASEQVLKYNELKLKRFYQEKYLKYVESTKK